jgi:putative ABC transport system permease protein
MPLLRRIANLFRRARLDREIDAEMQAHIEMRAADNLASGMSRDEARRDALLRFGNRTAKREQTASADAAVSLESAWADARYAFRQFRRSPGFAAIAILTLALGIGANTAVFSVTSTVLLRPLRYEQPERIFQMEKVTETSQSYSASIPLFLAWRDRNRVFERIAAYSVLPVGFNLAEQGRPERITGLRVSADFFRVLGIEPRIGRNLTIDDDRDGAPRVVVLSESLWRRRYNGDPAIVGRQITMDGEPATIVGVLPQGFRFLATLPTTSAIELWTPLRLPAASRDPSGILECIGRLKDGVTPAQASAQMTEISRQLARELPPAFPMNGKLELIRLQQRIGEDVRPALLMLLGATLLVLLIACANVANLFSVRVADRMREIAVRAALGAGRLRIAAQLLVESLTLAAAGGIAGVLVAWITVRLLAAMAPRSIARFGVDTLDWRALLFSLIVSIGAGLLFGVLPAFRASGASGAAALHVASSRRATAGKSHGRLSGLLTIGEMALSVVLLAAAGLLIESFVRLERVNAGFNIAGLTTFETTLPPGRYADPAALDRFLTSAQQNIRQLPRVEGVAAVSSLPTEPTLNAPFTIEGVRTTANDETGEVDQLVVSPGYFETLQIPVLEGRAIGDADRVHSPGVVVINQAMAKTFFPGRSPIGQRITIGKNLGPAWVDVPREIVGVVGDVRTMLDEPAGPAMYTPLAQVPPRLAAILLGAIPLRWAVRTQSGSGIAPDALSNAIAEADSSIATADQESMTDLFSSVLARWRFNMILLGAFAAIALALAAIGIYGVVSYSVARRTQEIGIRMAVGARRGEVLALVIRRGMSLAVAGAAIGLGAALLLTRLMRALLYGVNPDDPAILAGVSLLLVFIALVACIVPARRAAGIDPVQALRNE